MSTTPCLPKKIESAVREKLQRERRETRALITDARKRLRLAERELRKCRSIEESAWGNHARGPKSQERWDAAHKKLSAAIAAHFGYFDRVRVLEKRLAELYSAELYEQRLAQRASDQVRFDALAARRVS